jgi:hypothetical protein
MGYPGSDVDSDIDSDRYSDRGLGLEQPEADTLDQRRSEATDAGREPIGELPVEANEADIIGQHEVVPADDPDV